MADGIMITWNECQSDVSNTKSHFDFTNEGAESTLRRNLVIKLNRNENNSFNYKQINEPISCLSDALFTT